MATRKNNTENAVPAIETSSIEELLLEYNEAEAESKRAEERKNAIKTRLRNYLQANVALQGNSYKITAQVAEGAPAQTVSYTKDADKDMPFKEDSKGFETLMAWVKENKPELVHKQVNYAPEVRELLESLIIAWGDNRVLKDGLDKAEMQALVTFNQIPQEMLADALEKQKEIWRLFVK